MPATLTRTSASALHFRGLFPDWHGKRPLPFFFMEQLLEARAESRFPTNAGGYDEDVNVYLAGLLTRLAIGHDPGVALFGSGPQFFSPAKDLGPRRRAHWYRGQADQRLVYLGLFDRGEGRRRRADLFGLTHGQTRARDLVCGSSCYRSAADLLPAREGSAGLASVLEKLGRNFTDYVHVLGVLATRRLGLGAKLSDRQAAALFADQESAGTPLHSGSGAGAKADPAAMDELLDLWLEHQKRGTGDSRLKLLTHAEAMGFRESDLWSGGSAG